MRRIRASVLAGALVSLALLAVLLPAFVSPWSGQACASAAAARHAALVVGTGSRTFEFCVVLDATSVSGIHLIELAHSQDGLQYRLGFGGLAVCQLAGVGPTGGDCFADYPSYWGLWLGDGSGGWTWSGSGAGSVQIRDGDVEGWTWGTGDSGTTHPPPPATTFAAVCGNPSPTATGAPIPSVTPSHPLTPPPNQAANPGPASPSRTGGVRALHPGEPRSPVASRAGPSTVGTVQAAAAAGSDSGGGGGPPAGALLAIAGMVALGGMGWLRVRAGSRDPTSSKREGHS